MRRPKAPWALIGVFLLLLGIIGASACYYMLRQIEESRRKAVAELSDIADLKVRQISRWHVEQHFHANFIYDAPIIAETAKAFFKNPADAEAKARLEELMSSIQRNLHYNRVVLIDKEGNPAFSCPAEKNWLGPTSKKLSKDALRSGNPIISDIHASKMVPGTVDMDVFVPLKALDGTEPGVMSMEVQLQEFLFPTIQSWPTSSKTAETLLVRRDGEDIVFLNELRHAKNAPMTMRVNIAANPQLPAVMAILNGDKTVEGLDYRNKPVLAAVRHVPETTWAMVSKIDKEEVYAPIKSQAFKTGAIFLAIIVIAGLLGVFLWQRNDKGWFKRQLDLELERNKLDKQVFEEKERLLVTLRSIGDAVITTDPKGHVTMLNKVAEELTGWTGAEAQGRPLDEVFHIISEVSRELCESPVTKVLESGGIVGLANHTALVRRDGTERSIADSGAPIRDEKGEIFGVALVFRDVTEEYKVQKVLEEQRQLLELILEQALAGYWDWRVKDDKVFLSDSFKRMLGYEEMPPICSTAEWRALMHPEDLAASIEAFESHIRERGEAPYRKELRYRHKGGSVIHVLCTGKVVEWDEAGNPLRMIGCHVDISGRKELEERLRHSEKMDAIGQLAGGVAHDFNNQLGAILGYAEMLGNELSEPLLQSYAIGIMKAARRSSDLTKQLLAFARKGKYVTAPVNIHAVIMDVVSLLARSIDKRIEIRESLEAEPHTTSGDPTQLQNAFLNIAINARDAMPSGGVLSFATHVVELEEKAFNFEIPAGSYILVSVSDTGVGMDEETKQHLFEPFFTTKEVGKGTGLGLAAVYGTVKNHGGAVSVYSEPGHGTCFKIYLPLLSEVQEPPEQKPSEPPPAKASARILVVDDEELLRDMASLMLRKLGYEVIACKDGEEAIARYAESWHSIDLVILDMVMPKMGGRDTFIAMRKINKDLRSLLSSGYSIGEEAQEILNDGVLGFIQKPYSSSELAKKVAEAIGSRQPEKPVSAS